jgi:hypothetical protein
MPEGRCDGKRRKRRAEPPPGGPIAIRIEPREPPTPVVVGGHIAASGRLFFCGAGRSVARIAANRSFSGLSGRLSRRSTRCGLGATPA